MCSHFLPRLFSLGQLLCSSWAAAKGFSGIWGPVTCHCQCPCLRKPGHREALPAWCPFLHPHVPKVAERPQCEFHPHTPCPGSKQLMRAFHPVSPLTVGGSLQAPGFRLGSLISRHPLLEFGVFFLIFNIYLAVPGLSCSMQTLSWGMWDLLPQPGVKSAPCIGSTASLDHQGSPGIWVLRKTNLIPSPFPRPHPFPSLSLNLFRVRDCSTCSLTVPGVIMV